MKLLLDTPIWVWMLAGSDQLPEKLRKILEDESNQLWLSPISIWEVIVLSEKKQLQLSPNPIAWVREALQRFPLHEAALNREVAIKSRELSLPHQDPADRFLAATALIYELRLATLDKQLRRARHVPTL